MTEEEYQIWRKQQKDKIYRAKKPQNTLRFYSTKAKNEAKMMQYHKSIYHTKGTFLDGDLEGSHGRKNLIK